MSATLKLPEWLIRKIEVAAKAENLTPEQLVQKLIETHLERKGWEERVERGRRQAQALGYAEEDMDRIIHEHRAEKHSR